MDYVTAGTKIRKLEADVLALKDEIRFLKEELTLLKQAKKKA